jgi:hypothetical protein
LMILTPRDHRSSWSSFFALTIFWEPASWGASHLGIFTVQDQHFSNSSIFGIMLLEVHHT